MNKHVKTALQDIWTTDMKKEKSVGNFGLINVYAHHPVNIRPQVNQVRPRMRHTII